MDKREVILAAMAPAGGQTYSPVQIQKLIFLLDENIPEHFNGPIFDFQPYSYGPFDKSVYRVLERLAGEDLVAIDEGPYRKYRLTETGQKEAENILGNLPPDTQDYVIELSRFVRGLSFRQLVRAIYKAYPQMKVNSVFRG